MAPQSTDLSFIVLLFDCQAAFVTDMFVGKVSVVKSTLDA